MAHTAENSHSGAVAAAKWRENEPLRDRFFWEAEWNGEGQFPSDNELVRGADTCPEAVLKKIRDHYRLLQRVLNGKRTELPEIFTRPEFSDVRFQIASNTNASAAVLAKLAEDTNSNVRSWVASNTNASAAVLAKLAEDTNSDVRYWVARNTNASAAVLAKLAEDTNSNVRYWVARNTNASAAIRKKAGY